MAGPIGPNAEQTCTLSQSDGLPAEQLFATLSPQSGRPLSNCSTPSHPQTVDPSAESGQPMESPPVPSLDLSPPFKRTFLVSSGPSPAAQPPSEAHSAAMQSLSPLPGPHPATEHTPTPPFEPSPVTQPPAEARSAAAQSPSPPPAPRPATEHTPVPPFEPSPATQPPPHPTTECTPMPPSVETHQPMTQCSNSGSIASAASIPEGHSKHTIKAPGDLTSLRSFLTILVCSTPNLWNGSRRLLHTSAM
ncbi:hypothetical protein A0H81_05900 [Grifola frondosa]|uniref:Uncharacterized protein n=1 Tax=Grifola frondosa TaxID=5627 RepID=A0A1C7MC09_GRIFR|nr:hypothetical protein A0H81_05900 [Grifola frondosa]